MECIRETFQYHDSYQRQDHISRFQIRFQYDTTNKAQPEVLNKEKLQWLTEFVLNEAEALQKHTGIHSTQS